MSKKIPPQQLQHTPVLLESVVELLAPQPGETYLDLTAGYGGHARAVIEKTKSPERAVLVDRDDMAIDALKKSDLQDTELVHGSYADFAQKAAGEGKRFNMILVDLGVSSPQLDMAERGFSLKRDGPLDMRMDKRSSKTVADIVNFASEAEIIRIIEKYGEEPKKWAISIAKAIVRARPLETTKQLANVILENHRGAYQKTHPATRTFQAFRIALNDELGQLEKLLELLPELLEKGGRVALISFHSLEDRLVKRFFAEQVSSGYESEFTLLTKKPISGKIQDVHNPRSRSAMLRVAVKK